VPTASLDLTQEVGGSNPPSSIGNPCKYGVLSGFLSSCAGKLLVLRAHRSVIHGHPPSYPTVRFSVVSVGLPFSSRWLSRMVREASHESGPLFFRGPQRRTSARRSPTTHSAPPTGSARCLSNSAVASPITSLPLVSSRRRCSRRGHGSWLAKGLGVEPGELTNGLDDI
jgi:hypothetical protein